MHALISRLNAPKTREVIAWCFFAIFLLAIGLRILCFEGYADANPRAYAMLAQDLSVGELHIPDDTITPVFPVRIGAYAPCGWFDRSLRAFRYHHGGIHLSGGPPVTGSDLRGLPHGIWRMCGLDRVAVAEHFSVGCLDGVTLSASSRRRVLGESRHVPRLGGHRDGSPIEEDGGWVRVWPDSASAGPG